ncbi:MAG: efflux RND transporter periplasmic adaptor subunit [Acidobacteria bacterium]|nr:efflux RND transporter periplasmic adaptor subunit [Acidobacteriota bacterium]
MLAQLDAQSASDHIDDVSDTVRQAESDVRKRAAEQAVEFDQLSQTARVTKSELDKASWDLKASEIRTSIDQELLNLSVEESGARYKEALADLTFKKAAHGAELRILEITVRRQHRHLSRHVNDMKRFTVIAPMDGLVVLTSIFRGGEAAQVQEGDQISPGQTFMKVVNTNNMQVEATVNQTESNQFRIGQAAGITLDAFPGLSLKGHVYSIGALAVGGPRQNFYVRSVPVRVKIEGSDPRLIPDLSAGADIEVERQSDVLICRRDAVVREGDRSFVMVKQGSRFVRREVKTGLANDTEVAIQEGLVEGDEVRAGFGS